MTQLTKFTWQIYSLYLKVTTLWKEFFDWGWRACYFIEEILIYRRKKRNKRI